MSVLAYLAAKDAASKSVETSALRAAQALPFSTMTPASPAPLPGANKGDNGPSKWARTDFDERWVRSSTGPRTPENEKEMAALLEELATRDPKRAMAVALGEANLRLRQILRGGVLRGWASGFADDAAAWALALPDGDRQLSLESVFSGAVRHPDKAVRLATRLCAQNPEQAGDYGQFLVTALTDTGAYEWATRFATGQSTTKSQSAWVHAVFFEWAAHQPEQASRAFSEVSNPAVRDAAFKGLVLGWAMAEPATLVSYAMRLPPGEDRASALSQALPQWVGRDTLVASEWINHLEPTSDLDTGIAAVATLANLVNKRPDVAVGWAESITEPVLRANTLRTVAEQWGQRDPNGLRRFLSATPELRPADRTALADGLQRPPDG